MKDNFELTHDGLLKIEERLQRLTEALYDSEGPIDKDSLLRELNGIFLSTIDIRSAFTDGYCPDPSIKEALLANMQSKREANQDNFIK